MADITEERLLHLAKLCRINCSSKKRAELLRDFQQVVSYIEVLSEVDTDGVEPCNYVVSGCGKTPLREDEGVNTLDRELLLQIAPSSIAGLVRVPTVLTPSKN